MATETRITVLGAGSTMGLPMARNLARAGLQVRAWNRTGEKARPLEEHGVRLLESPAQATKGADVMVTMLSDADAVIDAVQDALPSVHPGIVWLQMSTIGEVGIERLRRSRRRPQNDAVRRSRAWHQAARRGRQACDPGLGPQRKRRREGHGS